MVASKRRNTLLTRWAPLACRARRVRLWQRPSSRAVRAVSGWSRLSSLMGTVIRGCGELELPCLAEAAQDSR